VVGMTTAATMMVVATAKRRISPCHA